MSKVLAMFALSRRPAINSSGLATAAAAPSVQT
jgi:hypothetical protein